MIDSIFVCAGNGRKKEGKEKSKDSLRAPRTSDATMAEADDDNAGGNEANDDPSVIRISSDGGRDAAGEGGGISGAGGGDSSDGGGDSGDGGGDSGEGEGGGDSGEGGGNQGTSPTPPVIFRIPVNHVLQALPRARAGARSFASRPGGS